MVDGFGIPEEGWFNSIYSKFCSSEFVELMAKYSIPVDSSMGVEGIPQSATAQTALFTGINAAGQLGKHIQGFPGQALRDIITGNSIFKSLIEKGMEVAFANAYVRYTLDELSKMNLRSVTTVMVQSTIGWVRNIDNLMEGAAVYHDLTNETLEGIPALNKISPEKAAENLAGIAFKYDFTLFEYFLTDKAGHSNEIEYLKKILGDFSSFFCRLVKATSENTILILTGDHGNCEDILSKRHTKNPVPLFVYRHPLPKHVSSIENIPGFITGNIFQIEPRQHV